MSDYQNKWLENINDTEINPLLRTYRLFKKKYRMEPYLKMAKNYDHRNAMRRFRCSSHTLEIERGRHTNPLTPISERLCPSCHVLDDEIHLMLFCTRNMNLRQKFFNDLNEI